MSSSFFQRLSPGSGKKDRERDRAEAEKRNKQLKDKSEENAIMQEVCQDIGGRLAGTVNIMEALQDEVELRSAQSERDKDRIRYLEGVLSMDKTGKGELIREKDELERRLASLERENQQQGVQLSLVREHTEAKDSAASYHKAKAESLEQALELRAKGSDGHGASQVEEDLRRVLAERDQLKRRLLQVEEKLMEVNIECQSVRAELVDQKESCKRFETETKAIQEDLVAVQKELHVSSLEGNEFLKESAEYKRKLEQEYEERSVALDRAIEIQVKSAEQRALGSEAKVEALESLVEKQELNINVMKDDASQRGKTIALLKDNISSLELSLQDMSRNSTVIAEELDSKDTKIQGLMGQVEDLSSQLLKMRQSSPTQPLTSDKGYVENLAEIERLAFEREDQLEDYEASLQSQQLSEASMKAALVEVKNDRNNLQFRLQEANSLLQDARIQLKTLDTETDKLRQSLASSKHLQIQQNKLISELKEAVESYHCRMQESDARIEMMQVEMQGLTELADSLNAEVIGKASHLDKANAEMVTLKEELKGQSSERDRLREIVGTLEQNMKAGKDKLEEKSSELLSAEQMISFLEAETDNLREELMISENNTTDSDSVSKSLKAKIAHLEEERDALLLELEEAEKMAMEEAVFTKENIRSVQLYSEKLEDMQHQVNGLQEEADVLRSQVVSYKIALEAKRTPLKESNSQSNVHEDESLQKKVEDMSSDLSVSKAMNDAAIAMKSMLENKIETLQTQIEDVQESRDSISREKLQLLEEVDGIIQDSEEEVKMPGVEAESSLESRVHKKIAALKEKHLELKAIFTGAGVKSEGVENSVVASPSLSDLRNINREIDNLTCENDQLRDELYQKEKKYSEAAEKNVELLGRITELEKEELSVNEKFCILQKGKDELQASLGDECRQRERLMGENNELAEKVSEQEAKYSTLDQEKCRLLEKIADLQERFDEQAKASNIKYQKEHERVLEESQSALVHVQKQLQNSIDSQSQFVTSLRAEHQELEDSLISAKEESYQLMDEMMRNFESVLHQARKDCLSVSNELVETISEAKSLHMLSTFSTNVRKGAKGHQIESVATHKVENDSKFITYDENTPIRTPGASIPNLNTPYTRIENILLNRSTGGRRSVLNEKRVVDEGNSISTAEMMDKIESAVSKKISELGLNNVAFQFESAVSALERVAPRESEEKHANSTVNHKKTKRRMDNKSAASYHSHHSPFRLESAMDMERDNDVHHSASHEFFPNRASADMEKLHALQTRLGRVEEKYKHFTSSDKFKAGKYRSSAFERRLSHQMKTVRKLEDKLQAKHARHAPLNSKRYLSEVDLQVVEKQTMEKLLNCNQLEQEIKLSKVKPYKGKNHSWRPHDSAADVSRYATYPANFDAHAFFGKRIFASAESTNVFENGERLQKLRAEMTKFQGDLWNGESNLDELESHALRAREIMKRNSFQNSHHSAFVV